uniref:PIF1/LRR1 pleckstrin homology domain-containing protein n=1 Tax=Trichobilharzia regenti TaxID=157069 RepID=A0AA85K9S1_TRIRE|nr:unnamed protein product [Trichobilharzia regenti]
MCTSVFIRALLSHIVFRAAFFRGSVTFSLACYFMSLSVRCSVVVEELAADKCTVSRRITLRESQISAVRDDLQQILIRITPLENSGSKQMIKKSLGYPVIEMNLYKNFLSQGKATICLPAHSVRIMISNCPPDKLRFFLGTLRTKFNEQ